MKKIKPTRILLLILLSLLFHKPAFADISEIFTQAQQETLRNIGGKEVKRKNSNMSYRKYAQVGMFCCDAWGVRRCALPAPGLLGSPCFCFGQGGGFTCY